MEPNTTVGFLNSVKANLKSSGWVIRRSGNPGLWILDHPCRKKIRVWPTTKKWQEMNNSSTSQIPMYVEGGMPKGVGLESLVEFAINCIKST